MRSEAGQLPLGPVTSPGYTRQARAALPIAVRLKLEAIEGEAAVALGRVRLLSDRARAASDEHQRLTRRLAELRANPAAQAGSWQPAPDQGPRARRWVPAPEEDLATLERTVDQLASDVMRLSRERDGAQQHWNSRAQLAERCREHLGL